MTRTRFFSTVAVLSALALPACGPQFPRKTEFRSQHYTQMPDPEWCAKARTYGWEPSECSK